MKPIHGEEEIGPPRTVHLRRYNLQGVDISSMPSASPSEQDADAEAEATKISQTELYHHGDEPTRPGYTLKELAHLARSSNLAQKLLALSVLRKVIQRYPGAPGFLKKGRIDQWR